MLSELQFSAMVARLETLPCLTAGNCTPTADIGKDVEKDKS